MESQCQSQHLPGGNETVPDPDMLLPYQPLIARNLVERKVILLATAPINKGSIFSNGLYQNIYIFYKLLEAIGYLPFFMQNVEQGQVDDILAGCRSIDVETFLQKPLPVYAYIEIGMSVDQNFRKFLKMIGARAIKIYLGNILNIDVETSQFLTQLFFHHHVVGEMTEIWVSPHYEQHREYAGILNQVYDVEKAKIVPYVWEPYFITKFGTQHPKWRPAAAGERETIVIMEPNISFQKSCVIPLLALEAYKQANPSWNARIIVVNGNRIMAAPHFAENVAAGLTIKEQTEYRNRSSITEIVTEFPNATFICHQVNNEYNYMVLELLYCGFPIIHNGERWAPFGYSYTGNSIPSLIEALKETREHMNAVVHKMSQAHALFWRHSIHNPHVQKAWDDLLKAA
jgi:hypothetical protein